MYRDDGDDDDDYDDVNRSGRHLTDDEISGMLIGLLLAGQHTSSTTSSWLGFFLAKHPDIQVLMFSLELIISVNTGPGPGPGPLWSSIASVSEHFLDQIQSMCSICSVVFVYFIETTLHIIHIKRK